MEIKVPIKLDCAEVTRIAVQRIMNEVEWKDDVSEEYKNGFYEFGNAVLKFLDKYCEEEKDKQTEKTTTDDKADTPAETDFKYFTAEQVRKMSQSEVKANYSDIRKSMELWG